MHRDRNESQESDVLTSMRSATPFAVLFLLPPLSANACLNDRDSDALAFEARRLPITAPALTREAPDIPGIVEVITGRFPRNPALYYTLRIARCQKELASDPSKLTLYDDIAVAYDKLGKSGEALVWIEKKHPRIAKTDTEALYRYFANIGTFRVHLWLHEGAKDNRIAELQQARDEIAEAIKLKPDAHFGREATQLWAMEWMLNEKQKKSFSCYLYQVESPDRDKILIGLAGLIALGNAWESMDVFGAIAGQLNQRGDSKVGFLAELRCRELMKAGKSSLFANVKFPEGTQGRGEGYLIMPPPRHLLGITNKSNVIAKYSELRTAADKWQATRTAFMEARLKTGHHPDTDTHFWDGYQETPPPSLDIPWHKEAADNFGNWFFWYYGWFWILIVAPSSVALAFKVRSRRKRC